MKSASLLFASAALALSAGVASANTINLASYGSAKGTPVPSGVDNTAVTYNGGLAYGFFPVPAGKGTTYNVSDAGVWTAPVGNSSWVAQNPGDGPNGGHVETDGVYFFQTTFTDLDPAHSGGSITVLADDTTSVYLNGNLITSASGPATAGRCNIGTPNCITPATYLLSASDFISGTNVLSFDVLQEHEYATGLDFAGSVNVTPEPGSLLLLSTGLASMGGFAFRRRQQA